MRSAKPQLRRFFPLRPTIIAVGRRTRYRGNERGSNLKNQSPYSSGKYNRFRRAHHTIDVDILPLRPSLPLHLSFISFTSATMNNQQFRRLVLDTPSASTRANKTSPGNETSPKQGTGLAGATPRALALGSRIRSSIPMTPYVTPSCPLNPHTREEYSE